MKTVYILVLCSFVILSGCAKKATIDPAATVPAAVSSTLAVESADAAPPMSSGLSAENASEKGVGEGRFSLAGDLETVYFEYDSYTLTGEARAKLNLNAQWLRSNPSAHITIEGHTDERGSDAYNLALGEKRARSALNYLIGLGIPADRIRIISYGEERPAVPGATEDAWSKNRRAEFM